MLFGGNLVRQPAFVQLKKHYAAHGSPSGHAPFRVIGDLGGADCLMNRGLFLGVYPGLSQQHLDFMADTIVHFCRRYSQAIAA
jgi:CDP-6-deoxy-D-xylo-4-hexulose-3-dehydrase